MSDQNGPRGFLQGRAGQLTLLAAAIIVLLFFAFTYVT
jgi:predicted secreted protein